MADTPTTSPETVAEKTAVIEACREGKLQVVQDHLQKGGDVDELLITKIGVECSLLMMASQCGHVNIVSYLLEAGAKSNVQNNKGWTALMLASQNGHAEIVKLLHQFGAQVDVQDENGRSALMLASQTGHSEVVKLLHEFGAQVDLQNKNGTSAFMVASQSGHSEVVKLLHEFGAQVDLQNKNGESSLMLARQKGHFEVVKLLHEFGAKLDVQERSRRSALMLASQNGHADIVKVLHEHGVPIDLQDENGLSALMLASCNGHSEVVKLLHQLGAQVDLQDEGGWSALMLASFNGHSQVVKLLHEFGAQVDLQQKDGLSALMIASQNGHSEVIKLLLELGAQVDLQNNNGWSALMIAVFHEHFEIVRLLQRFGAKHDPELSPEHKRDLVSVTSINRFTELFPSKEERLHAQSDPKELPTASTYGSSDVKSRTDSQQSDQYSSTHDEKKIQLSPMKKAQPPDIISHPEDQVLDHYGGKVTLSVTTKYGKKFKWFKDGEKIASDMYPHCESYDTPNLVISPFMPEDEGKYKCLVGNEADCVESNDAELSTQFDHDVLLCSGHIGNEGGRIKGAGIELYFPNDALPPGESSTVTVLATTDGPTEHFGRFSVTPIFHVKCEPYREFQREVQVTIEHFTKLEVEEDIDNLVFMVSRKDEEGFHPAAGRVKTEVGSRYGTVRINHFSRFGIFKRRDLKCAYSMLIALPVNPCTLEGFVWAFFGITVNSSTYTKIFEDYLKRFKDHPFHPIEQNSIESLEETVELTIPNESDVKPFEIKPSFTPPSIKKKDVKSKSRNAAAYPPRIRLDIAITEWPMRPLSCDIQLSGISGFHSFALKAVLPSDTPAARSRDTPRQESLEISQSAGDEINSSHHTKLYQQLREHAAKWREIGTHLGFKKGELDIIASKPDLQHEAPTGWLRAMLSQWLEWAPGDGRGSERRATLDQLKDAVSRSELGLTAQNLGL